MFAKTKKGATKGQDVRNWSLDHHCHFPLFTSAVYPSRCLCTVHCYTPKSRHAIFLTSPTCRHSDKVVSLYLSVTHWGSSGSRVPPGPTKGSHQAGGSVIYKDYQRNMMSKGKLQPCARPTGRQSWEAAQTEWMYLLFM